MKILTILLLQLPMIVNHPLPLKRELRDTTMNYIVIHNDESNSYTQTRSWLIKKRNSYHYYIKRDGTIVQLVDTKYISKHAGISYWGGHFNLNNKSLSICLQNNNTQEYTEVQYKSLSRLVAYLQTRYRDTTSKTILGHNLVAVPFNRKDDPGDHFDWEKFYSTLDAIKKEG